MAIHNFNHINDVGHQVAIENQIVANQSQKISYTEFTLKDKHYSLTLNSNGYYQVFKHIPIGARVDGTPIMTKGYDANLTQALNAYLNNYKK